MPWHVGSVVKAFTEFFWPQYMRQGFKSVYFWTIFTSIEKIVHDGKPQLFFQSMKTTLWWLEATSKGFFSNWPILEHLKRLWPQAKVSSNFLLQQKMDLLLSFFYLTFLPRKRERARNCLFVRMKEGERERERGEIVFFHKRKTKEWHRLVQLNVLLCSTSSSCDYVASNFFFTTRTNQLSQENFFDRIHIFMDPGS